MRSLPGAAAEPPLGKWTGFDAPRRLLYRAWTTPEPVKRRWCGERGTMDTVELDFRVGGTRRSR
ncbi:SRPBCC domain-containing protein [Streptomyces sp. OZ13]|uniref:SRPBCC domain-containing protein n=1 Tax=Streptomyces sp. OZ13 TaxID=3452210 RepID=UPI003F8B29C9